MLVALPATALGASTASIVGNRVVVTGDAAINEITVDLAGGTFTISDTSGVTAGAGCTQAGAVVNCPAGGIVSTLITGGDGGDTLIGSPVVDHIHGGSGSDEINGRTGNDILNSGRLGVVLDPNSPDFCQDVPPFRCGDDVNGGGGFDTATYDDRQGRIEVDLRPGSNVARDDDSTFDSVNAVERVVGGLASDEIIGGIFGETLNGGPGNAPDTLCGALGKDTVEYSDKSGPVNVTLDGVLPTDPDVLKGGAEGVSGRTDCRPVIKSQDIRNGLPCTPADVGKYASCPAGLPRDCTADDGISTEHDCVGEDVENIVGSPHDDTLIGNSPDALYGQGPRVEPSGQNVIEGGGGDDLIDGGFGADILSGDGEFVAPEDVGFDVVTYESRAIPVAASIDGAANDGTSEDFNPDTDQGDDILEDVDDLIGGSADDILKGDPFDNILLGGPGNDLVQGEGGDDQLAGDEGFDSLEGGSGIDLLDGGPDQDLLHGGLANDELDGGDGVDTVDYSDATVPVSVTPDALADDGIAAEGDFVRESVESAIGGLDDDHLTGNGGNGVLEGGGGNDVLTGGLGADLLIGGSGRDVASYKWHPGAVNVNLAVAGGDGMADEGDDITGDVEDVTGSHFDDVIGGSGDVNIINGFHGNDRISGAEGDDFLAGHLGNDTLNGDVGNDILDGAEGNDTLNGTAGNDTLRGFTGTDVLDGGAGADTMSGGDGVDTATYASRSADVNVDTHGTPDDGERNENDQIRTDVESLTTGSGDDTINISDGATGVATCGGGTDSVTADAGDDIGSGCEQSRVRQAGICVPTSRAVRLSGNRLSLRMNCAFAARGTIRLQSVGRIKLGKSKRKLTLGSKSFRSKIGAVTVRVNVSKRAARVIKRRKSLRVEAVLRARRDAANAAMRTSRTKITVRTSGKK